MKNLFSIALAAMALTLAACEGGNDPVSVATRFIDDFYAFKREKLADYVAEVNRTGINDDLRELDEEFTEMTEDIFNEWGELGYNVELFREAGYPKYFARHNAKYNETESTLGQTEAEVIFDVTSPDYPVWTGQTSVPLVKDETGKWIVDVPYGYDGTFERRARRRADEFQVDRDNDKFEWAGADSNLPFTDKTADIRTVAQKFADALCKFDFDACNKLMVVGEMTPPAKMTGPEKAMYDAYKALYDRTSSVAFLTDVHYSDEAAYVEFKLSHQKDAELELELVKKEGKWLVNNFE